MKGIFGNEIFNTGTDDFYFSEVKFTISVQCICAG